MERYFIKAGYEENSSPRHYRDSLEDSRLYQLEVYRQAGRLASDGGVDSVLDIGCGLATKLIADVWPHCDSATGVDSPDVISQCRDLYSVGRWIAGDLEDPAFVIGGTYDLIISADVIEHLRNPDRLLDHIRAASHPNSLVVLSTPERDLRRGKDDWGPPANRAHVREWNAEEFCAYLKSRGFAVRDSRIVDLREGMTTCHLVVGKFGRGEA